MMQERTINKESTIYTLLIEDFNAKVIKTKSGVSCVRKFVVWERSERGELLVEFIQE